MGFQDKGKGNLGQNYYRDRYKDHSMNVMVTKFVKGQENKKNWS